MLKQISKIAVGLAVVLAIGVSANAAVTELKTGDLDIGLASSWTLGLPSVANSGLINEDGLVGRFPTVPPNGAVVNQTGGIITSVPGQAQFNYTRNGTWNISGGAINMVNSILLNASGAVMNASGGHLGSDTSYVAPLKGAALNISGSVDIDAKTNYSGAGGTLDFDSNWTGSWNVTSYTTSAQWEAYLTTGKPAGLTATLDGAAISAAMFDSSFGSRYFEVSGDGDTLSIVPEPATMVLLGMGGLSILARRRRRA
jgi:hypothetical protein